MHATRPSPCCKPRCGGPSWSTLKEPGDECIGPLAKIVADDAEDLERLAGRIGDVPVLVTLVRNEWARITATIVTTTSAAATTSSVPALGKAPEISIPASAIASTATLSARRGLRIC